MPTLGYATAYFTLHNLGIFKFIVELPLGNKDKPLAVLNSNWHQIVQHLSLSSIEVPVVCVRRNVHYPVDKEKLLTDPVTLKYLYTDVSYCHWLHAIIVTKLACKTSSMWPKIP